MDDSTQDPFGPLNELKKPMNIISAIRELQAAGQADASAEVQTLEEITGNDTGTVVVDEIIAPAPDVEVLDPEDLSFYGAGMTGGGRTFGSEIMNFWAVGAGVLQAGFNNLGKFTFGGGAGSLSVDGITLLADDDPSILGETAYKLSDGTASDGSEIFSAYGGYQDGTARYGRLYVGNENASTGNNLQLWTETNVGNSANIQIDQYYNGSPTAKRRMAHTTAGVPTITDELWSVTSGLLIAKLSITQAAGFVFSGYNSGWFEILDTWTYASASTITIPTDGTTIYQKGDYIRFKQGGGYKYYTIVSLTATVITVIVNTDYVVANSAITDVAYSRAANPQGWPAKFNFTPTISASGGIGSATYTINAASFELTGAHRAQVEWDVTLDAKGTAAGFIQFSAPVTPSGSNNGYGRESAVTGKTLQAQVVNGNTTVLICDTASAAMLTTGYRYRVSASIYF